MVCHGAHSRRAFISNSGSLQHADAFFPDIGHPEAGLRVCPAFLTGEPRQAQRSVVEVDEQFVPFGSTKVLRGVDWQIRLVEGGSDMVGDLAEPCGIRANPHGTVPSVYYFPWHQSFGTNQNHEAIDVL